MNWTGWADFLSMRGYGLYVWGAYLVTAVALGLEPWLVRRHRRRALRAAANPPAED